jgi:hypothetical protein
VHGDRHPSCSVSLNGGAWRCWACDSRGGAYDAALAHGLSPRETMELLIALGLAERRHGGGSRLYARRSPLWSSLEPRDAPADAHENR